MYWYPVSSLCIYKTKSKPFTKDLCDLSPDKPIYWSPLSLSLWPSQTTCCFSLKGFCTNWALCLVHSSCGSLHLAFCHSGLKLNIIISEFSLNTQSKASSWHLWPLKLSCSLIISLHHHQTPLYKEFHDSKSYSLLYL